MIDDVVCVDDDVSVSVDNGDVRVDDKVENAMAGVYSLCRNNVLFLMYIDLIRPTFDCQSD